MVAPALKYESNWTESYILVNHLSKPFIWESLRNLIFSRPNDHSWKLQRAALKSERIRKRILHFFSEQINPRSFKSWCLKGTGESTLGVDSSVPLTGNDPRDLGLICLVKKCKIRFRILSDLKIQSWIFLKKRTLTATCTHPSVYAITVLINTDVFFCHFFNCLVFPVRYF